MRAQSRKPGPPVQTKPATPVAAHDRPPPPHRLDAPGEPLPAEVRRDLESRFGHSFLDIRIHAGADAAASARSLGAHAYTTGTDVVFGAGRYAPSTSAGRALLAHELTHAVQQAAGVVAPGLGQPGDVHEQRADEVAARVQDGRD